MEGINFIGIDFGHVITEMGVTGVKIYYQRTDILHTMFVFQRPKFGECCDSL